MPIGTATNFTLPLLPLSLTSARDIVSGGTVFNLRETGEYAFSYDTCLVFDYIDRSHLNSFADRIYSITLIVGV